MLADLYNCHVTGVDISEELVKTANELSSLLGLEDKCKYIVGNACDLPFEKDCFDLVWTQHVQMNIKDKRKFYSEISRVLIPDGLFVYYDIFIKPDSSIKYPMPWSKTGETSFLFSKDGFELIVVGKLHFIGGGWSFHLPRDMNFFFFM